MKKRNLSTVTLLATGAALFTVVETGLINPEVKAAPYDIGALSQYKTPYMGNASNFGNLNNKLPLSNTLSHTIQLYPERLGAEIVYKDSTRSFNVNQLRHDMIYDATANFVLIGNLKALTFHFADKSYSLRRNDIRAWYGTDLFKLQNQKSWNDIVNNKLADKVAVNRLFSQG